MPRHRIATRASLAFVPAIALAAALVSCATLIVRDDLPRDAAKGWVVFVSDPDLPVRASRISNGSGGVLFSNRALRGTPVAAACPPGPNEFLLRLDDRDARIAVPVAEGRVTYAGVWTQLLSDTPQSASRLRTSVGTHPLPFQPVAGDPAPLVTALVDRDWATRWAALVALRRISPPLEPTAAPLVTALAREDPYARVRAEARALLRATGRPVPAEPLLVVSYEQSAAGWALGEGLASETSLLPEGYLLAVNDPKGTSWRVGSGENAIAGRADLDVLMECRWLGGDGTNGYGLALGTGPATFDAFVVARNGDAAVHRFTDGRYRAAPLSSRSTAAAAITGTTVTRIEVSRRGARYAFSVNGDPVGAFVDETPHAVDRIGVFVDGAQSVVFRKIIVSAP